MTGPPLVFYPPPQGTSCSWLVGTIIVTITVSGCAQNSTRSHFSSIYKFSILSRGGLCESCYSLCVPAEQEQGKRRHQSEQSSRWGSCYFYYHPATSTNTPTTATYTPPTSPE